MAIPETILMFQFSTSMVNISSAGDWSTGFKEVLRNMDLSTADGIQRDSNGAYGAKRIFSELPQSLLDTPLMAS